MSQKMLYTNENFKEQEKQKWQIVLLITFAIFLLFFIGKFQTVFSRKCNKHMN